MTDLERKVADYFATEALRHQTESRLDSLLNSTPFADAEEQGSASHRTSRLDKGRSRPVLIATCAAAFALMLGIGWTQLNPNGYESVDVDPAATPSDPTSISALEQCMAELQSLGDQLPEGNPFPESGFDELTSLVFERSAINPKLTVVIFNETNTYSCVIDQNELGEITGWGGSIGVGPGPLPAGPEDVTVLDHSATGTAAETGPGTFYLFGRVGDRVSGIDVELPDQSTFPALVTHGWFLANGPIADGVALNSERVNWRLTDGRTGSDLVPNLFGPQPDIDE